MAQTCTSAPLVCFISYCHGIYAVCTVLVRWVQRPRAPHFSKCFNGQKLRCLIVKRQCGWHGLTNKMLQRRCRSAKQQVWKTPRKQVNVDDTCTFLFTYNEPINSETCIPPCTPTINISGVFHKLRDSVNKFSQHRPPQHTTQQPLLPVKMASNSVICSRENQHQNERVKTNHSFATAIAQRHLCPFRLRGQRRLVQLELPHSPG